MHIIHFIQRRFPQQAHQITRVALVGAAGLLLLGSALFWSLS